VAASADTLDPNVEIKAQQIEFAGQLPNPVSITLEWIHSYIAAVHYFSAKEIHIPQFVMAGRSLSFADKQFLEAARSATRTADEAKIQRDTYPRVVSNDPFIYLIRTVNQRNVRALPDPSSANLSNVTPEVAASTALMETMLLLGQDRRPNDEAGIWTTKCPDLNFTDDILPLLNDDRFEVFESQDVVSFLKRCTGELVLLPSTFLEVKMAIYVVSLFLRGTFPVPEDADDVFAKVVFYQISQGFRFRRIVMMLPPFSASAVSLKISCHHLLILSIFRPSQQNQLVN
jgi:hypothetical protein